MQESFVARKTASICAFISRQSLRYTYGGNTISPLQPWSTARFASSTASVVLNDAIAATTGTLSPTSSTTVDQMDNFSSKVSVALSPREPGVTIPVQPLSTSHLACFAMNAWSTFSSLSKAVVVAGITPRQGIRIAVPPSWPLDFGLWTLAFVRQDKHQGQRPSALYFTSSSDNPNTRVNH